MNQQEIQLLLDLKVRGEQEVTQDFARVAAEMARVADVAFAPLADGIAKKMSEALKGALDQLAGQNFFGAAIDRMIKSGGGQVPANSGINSSWLPGGPNAPGNANAPRDQDQRAPGGGYYRGPVGPAGLEMGGHSGFAREIAELSGRSGPEVSAMGAYARARSQAQKAGVQLAPMGEEEQGRLKGAIGKGREDIESTVKIQGELAQKVARLGEEIGGYTRQLSEIRNDATLTEGQKRRREDTLIALQEEAAGQRRQAGADMENAAAFITKTKGDVSNLSGALPDAGMSATQRISQALLGRATGGLGLAAAGLGLAGNMPLMAAQEAGARAGATGFSARAFMRGDLGSISSAEELGGSESVRGNSQLQTGAIGGGAALGAGLGTAALLGGPAGWLAGGGVLAYRAMNFQSDSAARMRARIEAQSAANEEQRTSESAMVAAGASAYGAAKGIGAPEATGLIMGREGGMRSRAGRMGVSGEEYERIAAQVAGTMGTTSGGGLRAGGSGGYGAIGAQSRLSGMGMGAGGDLFSSLYSGGMRGENAATGQLQATEQVSRIIEEAMTAGLDKSQVNALLGSIAENTSSRGLGGAAGAMSETQAELKAAQLAYGGNEIRGPEFENMQRGIQGLGRGARDQGGGIEQLVGLAETDVLGGAVKKAIPGFKGFSTKQRKDIQELGTTPQGLMNMIPGMDQETATGLSNQYMTPGPMMDEAMNRAGIPKTGDTREMVQEAMAAKGGYQSKSLEERQAFNRGAGGILKGQELMGPPLPPGAVGAGTPTGPEQGGAAGQVAAAEMLKNATLVSGGLKNMDDMLVLVNKGLDALQNRLNEGSTTGGFLDNLFGGSRTGANPRANPNAQAGAKK